MLIVQQACWMRGAVAEARSRGLLHTWQNCCTGHCGSSSLAATLCFPLVPPHLDTSIIHHWPASKVKAYSKLPAALMREPNRICMGRAVRWRVGWQGSVEVTAS